MDTMMTKSIALLAALAALSAPALADSYGSKNRNCDFRSSDRYENSYGHCKIQKRDDAGLTITNSDFDREQRRLDEKNDGNNNGGGGVN
jgi:hypothetical protein